MSLSLFLLPALMTVSALYGLLLLIWSKASPHGG
jgi:hypothetical protein